MALSCTPLAEVEFSAGVWTDVSSYTREVGWNRGGPSEFDEFPAGSGYAILSNADRRFDPEHSTGPYYGDLLPRKRLRVGFSYGATTYWKFTGYIRGWPQAYNGPNDATVTVRAVDAFTVAARARRLPSVWQQTIEAATTVDAWYRLGEGSGTQAADTSGNKHHATYEGGATFNHRAGLPFGDSDGAIGFDGVDDLVLLPLDAAVDTNAAFTIEFWIEMPNTVGNNDQIIFEQSQGQATDAAGVVSILVRGTAAVNEGQINVALISSGTSAILDSGVRVDDGGRHHVAVTADGSFLRLYIDGNLVAGPSGYTALTSAVSWLRIADGKIGSGTVADGFRLTATLDEFVIHNDDLSAATVTAHYEAGTAPWEGDTPKARIDRVLDYLGVPNDADNRDLDTGSAELIAATLETDGLTHMQEVARSEGGRFFVSRTGKWTLVGRQNGWSEAVYNTSNATFGDGAGELRYAMTGGDLFDYDDEKIVNEARVRQDGGTEQVAADSTSQAAYGLFTHSESTLEARAGVVLNRAEYLVYKHKDPGLRLPTVTILPERDPANLYDIVGANDLGYRYTFKRRPQNVGSAISKEVHVQGESGRISPETASIGWELVPAEPDFGGWDSGTWEGTFRWAY